VARCPARWRTFRYSLRIPNDPRSDCATNRLGSLRDSPCVAAPRQKTRADLLTTVPKRRLLRLQCLLSKSPAFLVEASMNAETEFRRANSNRAWRAATEGPLNSRTFHEVKWRHKPRKASAHRWFAATARYQLTRHITDRDIGLDVVIILEHRPQQLREERVPLRLFLALAHGRWSDLLRRSLLRAPAFSRSPPRTAPLLLSKPLTSAVALSWMFCRPAVRLGSTLTSISMPAFAARDHDRGWQSMPSDGEICTVTSPSNVFMRSAFRRSLADAPGSSSRVAARP